MAVPVLRGGPYHFWPRVLKFIIGESDKIIVSNANTVWPGQAYKLKFDPGPKSWEVEEVTTGEPRVGLLETWLDWRGKIDGVVHYVHWRGEPWRNAFLGGSVQRSTQLFVDGQNRNLQSFLTFNIAGACLYMPTSGALEGQLQVIVAESLGTFIRFYRMPYSNFMSGSGMALTALSVDSDNNLGQPNQTPSVFFSASGKKASYVEATGDNDAFENQVVDIEFTISDDCTSVSAVRTIHGPFYIERDDQRSLSDLLHKDVVYTDAWGVEAAFSVHDPGEGQYVENTADIRIPIGADYIGESRQFVYLNHRIGLRLGIFDRNLEMTHQGPTSEPTDSLEEMQIHAQGHNEYLETFDAVGDIYGNIWQEDLLIGSRRIEKISYCRAVGVWEYHLDWDVTGTLFAFRTDPDDPDSLAWRWIEASVWESNLPGAGVGGYVQTDVQTVDVEWGHRGNLVLVDARYGVACFGREDERYGIWHGVFEEIDEDGRTDCYYAYDITGLNEIIRTVPPEKENYRQGVPSFGPRESTIGDSTPLEFEWSYLSTITQGADSAVAHHRRGLAVVLGTFQVRFDEEAESRLYITGDQSLTELCPNVNFDISTSSWAIRT